MVLSTQRQLPHRGFFTNNGGHEPEICCHYRKEQTSKTIASTGCSPQQRIMNHLLHVILEAHNGAVHNVAKGKSLDVIWKRRLGDCHDLFPMTWHDARLAQVLNYGEDFLEVRDLVQQHLSEHESEISHADSFMNRNQRPEDDDSSRRRSIYMFQ